MQTPQTMAAMMQDLTQYIMLPKLRYAQGIGTYASYDIAAYDGYARDIVALTPDVTADRALALRMCGRFNRYRLSTIHLEEAILDMLG